MDQDRESGILNGATFKRSGARSQSVLNHTSTSLWALGDMPKDSVPVAKKEQSIDSRNSKTIEARQQA
jgi:hypothetical protein